MKRRTLLVSVASTLLLMETGCAASEDRARTALLTYAKTNLSPLPIGRHSPGDTQAWAILESVTLDLNARGDYSEAAIRSAIQRGLKRDAETGRFARYDGFTVLATHDGLARLLS